MVSHVRQLAVLLSRNSASLTSSGSRTLTQTSWTQLTWCRLRDREPGLERLHHGSSVVLQDHQSENSEAVGTGKGLTLSENCVKVTTIREISVIRVLSCKIKCVHFDPKSCYMYLGLI